MDHDVVADQAYLRAALHLAVGDHATRDVADLRDVEDLLDLGIAEHRLAQSRRQKAGHRRFHIVHEIVDDVVVADLDARTFGGFARFLVRADVECQHHRTRRIRERNVGFRDAADAGVQDARPHFVVAELLHGGRDGFDGTLHVALDDEREFLLAGRVLGKLHHVHEAARLATATNGSLITLLALAVGRDFTGTRFTLDHRNAVTRFRRALEAQDLDRK